jgi:hypothetical protein
MAVVYSPVTVNLKNEIDASANIEVFGPSAETLTNILVCSGTLDRRHFFDGSDGIIEFWEPSNARGTVEARMNSSVLKREQLLNAMASSLHYVLTSSIDASGAAPFSVYTAQNNAYWTYPSFGELALAYAADDLFGHVAATAAITNDVAVVDGFDSNASVSSPVSVAATPSQTDQALAQRLCAALYASSDVTATYIANTVLKQDAARARDQDNNEIAPDVKQHLRFVDGDVVYMSITLHDFSVDVGQGQQYTPVNTAPSSVKYYLKIRLSD